MAGPLGGASSGRRPHRASVSGDNVGLCKKKGAGRLSGASSSSKKGDASRLLKATLAEEERKQLAAWLDKKHKELDTKLKKMGVLGSVTQGSDGRPLSRSAPGGAGQQQAATHDQEDLMIILGRRLGRGTRPLHTHRMEYILEADEEGHHRHDEEDEDAAISFFLNEAASSSAPSSYRRHYHEQEEEDSPPRRRDSGSGGGGGGGDRAPLPARLAHAAQQHQYNRRQVLELFFPLWQDRHESSNAAAMLPLDQVMDVLHVDLGLRLTKAEQRELEREADKDLVGGRIDVRGVLLEPAGLWPAQEGEEGDGIKGRGRLHWAMGNREVGPKPDPKSARRRLKERQYQAAVQIQRLVRGKLSRNYSARLRFHKATSRHHQADAGPRKPTTSSRSSKPIKKAFQPEEEEEEEEETGHFGSRHLRHGARNKGAKSKKKKAVEEEEEEEEDYDENVMAAQRRKQQQLEDDEFDMLLERALAGGGGDSSSSGGTSAAAATKKTTVELLAFPFHDDGGGHHHHSNDSSQSKKQQREKDVLPLFEDGEGGGDGSGGGTKAPYGEALIKCVAKGGEPAFYRLATILRSQQQERGAGTSSRPPFLPYSRVRMALKEAGLVLTDPEARDFLLGVAADKHGWLDASEVLQAIADLLQEVSLVMDHGHAAGSSGGRSALNRSWPSPGRRTPRPGSYMWPSSMTQHHQQGGRSSRSYSPPSSSRRKGVTEDEVVHKRRRRVLGAGEGAVLTQLLGANNNKGRGRHSEDGAGRLSSKRLMAPFLERDPFQDGKEEGEDRRQHQTPIATALGVDSETRRYSGGRCWLAGNGSGDAVSVWRMDMTPGYLPLLDFAAALDDLGLVLEGEDIAELAFKYRCPEEVMAMTAEEGGGGGGMGVDYAPFVRMVVEEAGRGGRSRSSKKGRSRGRRKPARSEDDDGDSFEEEDDDEDESPPSDSSFDEDEEEEQSSQGRRRRGRATKKQHQDEDDDDDEPFWGKPSFSSSKRRKSRHGGSSSSPREFLSDRDHEERHVEAIRSIKDLLYGQGDKRRYLKSLRVAFAKADPLGRGSVDRKTLTKVLRGGGTANHANNKVVVDVGERELLELASFLACKQDEGQLSYPRLLRVWDAVLDCPKEEAHELMDKLLRGVGRTASLRLRWVRRLKRLVTEVDKYRTGLLEEDEVCRLMRRGASGDRGDRHEDDGDDDGDEVLALSKAQLKSLAQAFLTEDMEGVAYRPMLRSLAQHAGRWYELDPDAATQLLVQFPKMSPPTRFLSALRRAFRELDSGSEGRLDVDDVDYCLRKKARLQLDDREASHLLDVLSMDGSGKVYYEDLLAFLELYQLPWHELVADIAQDLSERLFSNHNNKEDGSDDKAAWRRFSTLRCRLYERDGAKQGQTTAKVLREVMTGVGLGLSGEDFMRLTEALEVVGGSGSETSTKASRGVGSSGSSKVRYRELLRHLLELKGGEAREEVTEEFIHLVRKHLAEHQGAGIKHALAAVTQGCAEDDEDKSGRVSIETFRKHLQRAGVRVELEDVGRLADFCDFYGDGRIAYREIMEQVKAGHALPSSWAGGKTKRKKKGASSSRGKDWSWTRLPAVSSLRSALLKVSDKAARDKVVRKAFKECDRQDEGTVAVEDLEDIWAAILIATAGGGAAAVSPGEVRELGKELFSQSYGNGGPGGGRKCIAYDELCQALTLGDKEFRARYPQPTARRPGTTQQLLYEKVLDRKRGVAVVGRRTPKDRQADEDEDDRMGGTPEGAFMAGCRKVDRRRTGTVSVQEARRIAAQAGLKPPMGDMRALLDKHTVSGSRVNYTRVVDDCLGRSGRRGSLSSSAGGRGGGSASSSYRISQAPVVPAAVVVNLPPRVAKLVKALSDLKEDDVHIGTLGRTLARCGFAGSADEVMALTRGILGMGARAIKKGTLINHIQQNGPAILIPPPPPIKEDEEEGGAGWWGAFAANKVSAF